MSPGHNSEGRRIITDASRDRLLEDTNRCRCAGGDLQNEATS